MKNLIFAVLSVYTFSSCGDRLYQRSYVRYEPVYLNWTELENSASVTNTLPVASALKLWIYGRWLFAADGEGLVHALDLKDPARPSNRLTLSIPGNHDIAVKDGILYADNYTDLLAWDMRDFFKNPSNSRPVLMARVKRAFPQDNRMLYPWRNQWRGWDVNTYDTPNVSAGVVVGWKIKSSETRWEWTSRRLEVEKDDSGGSAASEGGSTSRFSVRNDGLYVADGSLLKVFSLSQEVPLHLTNLETSNRLETLYPKDELLLAGSETGTGIFKFRGKDTVPELSGWLSHPWARDPVVYDGRWAFVTLGNSTLLVLDALDIHNPVLTNRLTVNGPHGLIRIGNALWICTDYGIAIFDASHLPDLAPATNSANYRQGDADCVWKPWNRYEPFHDLVRSDDLLYLAGSSGIAVVDVKDPFQPVALSSTVAPTADEIFKR